MNSIMCTIETLTSMAGGKEHSPFLCEVPQCIWEHCHNNYKKHDKNDFCQFFCLYNDNWNHHKDKKLHLIHLKI